MIELEIDLSELFDLMEHTRQLPAKTPEIMARGINKFGAEMKNGLVQYLAATTGFDPANIESVAVVQEANPQNLSWSVDAGQALVSNSDSWQRAWSERNIDSSFEEQVLLDIICQDDCCELCAQFAQEPHTALEISNQAAEWKDFVPTGMSWLTALTRAPVTNLLHPNCRCTTTGHDDLGNGGKLPIQFEGGQPQMLSCEEIGHDLVTMVMDEVEQAWRDELEITRE